MQGILLDVKGYKYHLPGKFQGIIILVKKMLKIFQLLKTDYEE